MGASGVRRQGRARDRRRRGDRLCDRARLRPARARGSPSPGAPRTTLVRSAAAIEDECGPPVVAGRSRRGRGRRLRTDDRDDRRAPWRGRHPRQQRGSFAVLPLIDADAAEAARFFAVNAIGPLNAARAFARWAIDHKRGGAIVNVSSIAAGRPAPGLGLYSASKAALDSLTRSMAVEWAGKGLRVNAVAPGHVATEGVLEDFRTGRLDEKAVLARIPGGPHRRRRRHRRSRPVSVQRPRAPHSGPCADRRRRGRRSSGRSTIRPPNRMAGSSSLLTGASWQLQASSEQTHTVADRAAPTNRICWYNAQSIATKTHSSVATKEIGKIGDIT